MTKGTKIFRIIISVLLALTMLWGAILGLALVSVIESTVHDSGYNIFVAGKEITKSNAEDVLGDGTVYYDIYNNVLTFNNATIECESTVVYSKIDFIINLIGENKFVCTGDVYGIGVYAGDQAISKDLAIMGDGSLTIEIPNSGPEAAGISAGELTLTTDVTVNTPDCENSVHGIVCGTNLLIVDGAAVTVNNGAAKYSSAVRVRGNAFFEEGSALNVSVNPGSTGVCKGFTVSGDLYLGKDTSLDVSVDDESTELGECIRISGLMEVGIGSCVTASAKNAYAVECFGAIEANEGAVISAVSDKKDADIFCSGALVNYGATVNAEAEALGGIHNKAEG